VSIAADRRLVYASFVALLLGCGGNAAVKTGPPGSVDSLSSKEAEAFRRELAVVYPAYKTLKVGFTLKGKVDNQEVYYEGAMSATPAKLTIRLTDAVFLSPLLTLEIGETTVTLQDHARNKKESIPRKDYQWVELFGRSFPVRFFEPLMRGFVPADAIDSSSTYLSTPGGDTQVRSSNDSYEAALYFNDNRLRKIFYRDKMRGEILVFQIGALFKNRAYPQKMRIEHSRSNDYLTLDFKGLRVTGETTPKK
jgi:hypothetical protein